MFTTQFDERINQLANQQDSLTKQLHILSDEYIGLFKLQTIEIRKQIEEMTRQQTYKRCLSIVR